MRVTMTKAHLIVLLLLAGSAYSSADWLVTPLNKSVTVETSEDGQAIDFFSGGPGNDFARGGGGDDRGRGGPGSDDFKD